MPNAGDEMGQAQQKLNIVKLCNCWANFVNLEGDNDISVVLAYTVRILCFLSFN